MGEHVVQLVRPERCSHTERPRAHEDKRCGSERPRGSLRAYCADIHRRWVCLFLSIQSASCSDALTDLIRVLFYSENPAILKAKSVWSFFSRISTSISTVPYALFSKIISLNLQFLNFFTKHWQTLKKTCWITRPIFDNLCCLWKYQSICIFSVRKSNP